MVLILLLIYVVVLCLMANENIRHGARTEELNWSVPISYTDNHSNFTKK